MFFNLLDYARSTHHWVPWFLSPSQVNFSYRLTIIFCLTMQRYDSFSKPPNFYQYFFLSWSYQESNLDLEIRSFMFYPLNYMTKKMMDKKLPCASVLQPSIKRHRQSLKFLNPFYQYYPALLADINNLSSRQGSCNIELW